MEKEKRFKEEFDKFLDVNFNIYIRSKTEEGLIARALIYSACMIVEAINKTKDMA